MQAFLIFSLPEEVEEHEMAIKGGDWKATVADIEEWLREKLKYGHEFKSADEALEAARKELHELLDSNGLILY